MSDICHLRLNSNCIFARAQSPFLPGDICLAYGSSFSAQMRRRWMLVAYVRHMSGICHDVLHMPVICLTYACQQNPIARATMPGTKQPGYICYPYWVMHVYDGWYLPPHIPGGVGGTKLCHEYTYTSRPNFLTPPQLGGVLLCALMQDTLCWGVGEKQHPFPSLPCQDH